MSEQTLERMEQRLTELDAKIADIIKSRDVERLDEIKDLAKQSQELTRKINELKIAATTRVLTTQITERVDASGLSELKSEDIHTVIWFREDPAGRSGGIHINPEGWGPEPKPAEETSRVTARKTVAKPGNRTHQRIGSRLLREHALACRKGYYSKDGTPYQKPVDFPVALFDPDGYLVIPNEDSMLSSPYLNVGKRVSVPMGISSAPRYHACGHRHG